MDYLSSLDLNLLDEIIKHLDLRSCCRLRQTSKALQHATEGRWWSCLSRRLSGRWSRASTFSLSQLLPGVYDRPATPELGRQLGYLLPFARNLRGEPPHCP